MSVEDTVRNLWATRPQRHSGGRKIAGVAAAIGRRYAIDPVLVRVAFVVATLFSGVGILVYLLGWLLLPAEGDDVSAAESLLGRGHSSVSSGLTVVLGIALIPAVGIVFDDIAYGVIGLAATACAIFLLHRSRAGLGQAPVPGNPHSAEQATGAEQAATGPSGTEPGTDGTGSPAQRQTPPAWDPLSAAPFAWDLPDPTPVPPQAPHPSRAPRSKVTPITLGLALLTAGLGAAFWPALSLVHIVALVLGVVGLGLVIGSLLQGGRGLITAAVPLVLLVWVLHAVPVTDFRVGESAWVPLTPAQVQPRYTVTMGNGFLDLSRLQVPDDQTVRTAVWVGLGEAEVSLPPNVDTQVICRAPVGATDCLDVSNAGIPARVDTRDVGSDGPGGGTLILDVRSGVGNTYVARAEEDQENG